MIIFTKVRDLLLAIVGSLSSGTVTTLLLLLSALFGYLALFAPLSARRKWLGLAL